jgi:c-di-GMP-binding flagellar brake protein YcgR
MDEKRSSVRVAYACEVECQTGLAGQSPLNPRISDLSAAGAFIDTITPLPVGTIVQLHFALPAMRVSVKAEVVNCMAQFGMGVRFLDLTPRQQVAINEIVRSRS